MQVFTNNHTSFHLCCMEDLFNHQKVSNYYEQDCRLYQNEIWLDISATEGKYF